MEICRLATCGHGLHRSSKIDARNAASTVWEDIATCVVCSRTVTSSQQAVLCPQIHVITTKTTAAAGGIRELTIVRRAV